MGVHGYLTWSIGTSLQHCDRTQIVSDWAKGGNSKTHQRMAGKAQGDILVIVC